MAVFGPQGVVIRVNLALGNPVPTGVAYDNQVAAATANENLYLSQITQPFVGLSNAAYSVKVLTGLGVTPPTVNQASYDALLQALTDYLAFVGVANRGIVTRQLGELLSALEADATFGLAAQQFNDATDDGFAANNDPDPIGNTSALTGALDLFSTKSGDTVVGDENTLTTGDKIVGPGDVELVLTNAGIIGSNTTITGANHVSISSSGTSDITTKNWTGLGELDLTKITGNLTVRDLQSAVTPVVIDDAIDAASTITLNYDAQSVVGATKVAIGLKEVNAALTLTGGPIETVTLADNGTANFANSLADLSVTGIQTLNITGGVTGNTFGIVGALDAGLVTINASTLRSNLSLNVAESTKAMNVTLGLGDDLIAFGNTLNTGDSVNGGPGSDRVSVVFTSDLGTRIPTLRSVETLEATFNANTTYDGSDTDDLAKIVLNASSERADFKQMDSTLTTVDVAGNLARGVEIDYADFQFAPNNNNTSLTVNITGETSQIGGGGGNDDGQPAIRVINAQSFALIHNGVSDVVVSPGIQVTDDQNGSIETQSIRIQNNSSGNPETDDAGNLTIQLFNNTAIKNGNSVLTLAIQSTGTGDISIGDVSDPLVIQALALQQGVLPDFFPTVGATMAEAAVLRTFTIASATDSDITAGIVGGLSLLGLINEIVDPQNISIDQLLGQLTGDAANNLNTVSISAGVSSEIAQYGIDTDDALGGSNTGANIQNVTITGARSSIITLGGDGLLFSNLTSILSPTEAIGASTAAEYEFQDGFNWLEANRVQNMTVSSTGLRVAGTATIETDERSTEGVNDVGVQAFELDELIGLNLDSRGGTLTVTGSADVSGFVFEDEAFAIINASGHTNTASEHLIDVSADMFLGGDLTNFVEAGIVASLPPIQAQAALADLNNYSFVVATTQNTSGAFAFSGSTGDDLVNGSNSSGDNLSGGAGNDFLFGGAGGDTVTGGAGNDYLRGGDLGGGFTQPGQRVLYTTDLNGPLPVRDGNDVIDGGAGNDVIIGDESAASTSFGDRLTGGDGNDLFVFNLGLTAAHTNETGKSTNSIKADVITDFTTGGDRIVIDIDSTANAANGFQIAVFNGQNAAAVFDGTFGQEVSAVARRGNYNQATGQFSLSDSGADFQLLFNTDGAEFTLAELTAGGGNAFNAAEFEIALLGAAANNGSIAQSDIVFI